jgi:hypothetical protein
MASPYDPVMAQAIYQAVRKGLMLSGLIPQEAERIAQSVQQMYQGGQLPNVTNPQRDPSAIFNALNKGLGPASNMATPVGTILTGGPPSLSPTATDPGYDTGIPEEFLGGTPNAWPPPLPITQEIEVPPGPISSLAGRTYKNPSSTPLRENTTMLMGGQTPVAITPPEGLPNAAMAAGGPGPRNPSTTFDKAALLRQILAALQASSAPGEPDYAMRTSSDNYAGATNLGPMPTRLSWLNRNRTVGPALPVGGER